MSSSSPRRPDRRTALLLLVLVSVLVVGPGAGLPSAAAAVPLSVIAVIPGARETSVVVDLGAGTKPADTVAVTVAGAPQRATVTPALSDHMAVALVVDASEAGAAALPGWLSAAARFALEVPAQARTVVVADTAPPTVIAAPQPGAMGVVGALSTVRAAGRRSTSNALTLAIDQLPVPAAESRVVVLYTTAREAGGESAAALSGRLAVGKAMLVVVGVAAAGAYWSGVSRSTGGFFAPTSVPVVVPALDQVATTLRGRYRVTFPTPQELPARLSIRVNAGDLTLTADTVVGPNGGFPSPPASGIGTVFWSILLMALIAVAVVVLLWRRPGRHAPPAPHRCGPSLGARDPPTPLDLSVARSVLPAHAGIDAERMTGDLLSRGYIKRADIGMSQFSKEARWTSSY